MCAVGALDGVGVSDDAIGNIPPIIEVAPGGSASVDVTIFQEVVQSTLQLDQAPKALMVSLFAAVIAILALSTFR
jgi:hypothetical protein